MVKMIDKVEIVEVDKLIPYINNPKEHPPDQVDKIASSIKNFGFTVPLVIDGENEIIAGHGRLEAAKKLDLEKIPVIKRDDLTEAQAKALRIADNKVAESSWDMNLLSIELEELEDVDFDLEKTGFSDNEISGMLEEPDLDNFFEEEDLTGANADEENEDESITCPNCGEVIEI